MSESINCDNYNDYFTPAVLAAVRPYEKKLPNRNDGGLSADDLIQTAIMMLIRRKRATVQDMAKLLTRNILYAYVIWVRGSETGRQGTQQDRYMAGVPIEPHSTIKELTIADPSKDWMLLLDIDQAVRKLDAKEQRMVRLKFWDGLSDVEIGKRLGVSKWTVVRHMKPILAWLRVELASYAPEHGGKTLPDSSVVGL